MAERKTDYFGTFLDAMKGGRVDPLSQVLKALRSDERSMKDVVNLTGNSLSDLIDVIGKLEGAGLVERTRDGNLSLTDKGRGDAMAVE